MSDTAERNFEIGFMPCIVTKIFDTCIRVKLGEIIHPDGEQTCEIIAQFSEAGLKSLLSDLESAPFPLNVETPDQIREGTEYGWAVYVEGNRYILQYPKDKEETHLREIDFSKVISLEVQPRFDKTLPHFGFDREDGFYLLRPTADELVKLDLPFPKGRDFQWNYYRRVTKVFQTQGGQVVEAPAHVVQVFGWQIGDVICEIGVEEDGSWQTWKKSPEADALCEKGVLV